MRLVNVILNGRVSVGSITAKGVLNLPEAAAQLGLEVPQSLDYALTSWDTSLALLSQIEHETLRRSDQDRFFVDASQVKFRAPVTSPSKILCVYVNYRTHGKEVGTEPGEPLFFFKHSRCICGDGDDVHIPAFSSKPDHEVELAIIIGKEGKDIQPESAYQHIAGYTVANDISFRDGNSRGIEGTPLGRNLFRGKVADTSLPMGPFLVTKDEIPDPYPLKLRLKVNDEVRQDGTTNDMIFKIPEIIASASEANTLLPGDVISTGTCSGVGLYTGKYLHDGDQVEAEIEKLGLLRNNIRMPNPRP